LVTIRNSDPAVAKAIEALSRELERKEQALTDARQREVAFQERDRPLQVDLAALKEAITAIPKQTEIPNAQARIRKALAAAADGDTALAEAIFSEVEARKIAEGKTAYQTAAEAARHRGALAFLHDTDTAIAAYRRATELDPENADGWNWRGHLLYRTGALDDAEAAYRKVESLGKSEHNREFLAVAYGNLGVLYWTHGDLEQAEAMYRKGLAIDEQLGRKEGIAKACGTGPRVVGNTEIGSGDRGQSSGEAPLEPVYDLWINKERSTTHRLGITVNVCSSFRLATATVAPSIFRTAAAKGCPV